MRGRAHGSPAAAHLAAGHLLFLPVKLVEAACQRRWRVLQAFCLAWARLPAALESRARERQVRGRRDCEVLRVFRESARASKRPRTGGPTGEP
jgi:hypothetical protein